MAAVEVHRRDVEKEGFSFFPAGRELITDPAVLAKYPDLVALPPERSRHLSFGTVFAGDEVAARLPDLEAVMGSWRPQVLIHEQSEMAGAIAAAGAGIPHVTVSFGVMVPAEFVITAQASVAPHWRAAGLEPEPMVGLYTHLYLDTCPPSLQLPQMAEVKTARPLRPIPFGVEEVTARPAFLDGLRPPVVYLTLGTVFGRTAATFAPLLEGLREEAGSLVVTVGGKVEPAELGPQPDHVHIRNFIPQAQLLPSCDLVATHCGSGSMLGALGAGLPLLALPQGADQFLNSERLLLAGAGLVLNPAEVTVLSVREAARVLLRDSGPREAARRIQTEIAAMPAPEAHVATIESLVDSAA